MAIQIDPERVVVACVFDQNVRYQAEAVLLFGSLIRFGGRLAGARRRAYCVGSVDLSLGAQLERLGVEVVETAAPVTDFPLANKLCMFEKRSVDEELLLALDTDVVVAGDITDWLQSDVVAAKPVDHNPLSETQWKLLYAHFGIELPLVRLRTHFHNALVPPYFNSGVISFPCHMLDGFADRWAELIRLSLADLAQIAPGLEPWRYYAEQWSFALAVQDRRLMYSPLPLALNYPTHSLVHSRYSACEPLLLHHHHRLGCEGIVPSGNSVADNVVRRVNSGLAGFYETAVHPLISEGELHVAQ